MTEDSAYSPPAPVITAGQSDLGSLFRSMAAAHRQQLALVDGDRRLTYQQLDERSNRLASVLIELGLQPGDRVAVLLRNCAEYFELELAAAKANVIVAALNYRLSERELQHCLSLASPGLVVVSEEFLPLLNRLDFKVANTLVVGQDYEARLAAASDQFPDLAIDPESGLIILYTSGTTGLPKGALISHRAMLARAMVFYTALHVPQGNQFPAWTPMYHMVATDQGLATLLNGGTVWCVDGYQPDKLLWLLENVSVHWFVMVPGMIDSFIEVLKSRPLNIMTPAMVGAMADLVPREQIRDITQLLQAPFLNTFGATETGFAPASGALIPIGELPETLSKTQTAFCDLRLLDPDGHEVAVGEPGEAAIKGPTLFSGYWQNDKTNREDFRGGRFHMGDLLRRNEDGSLDYVDRVKYMIKSGGENIYPAEIEQLIMQALPVAAVVVVRKVDAKWGEVPVAFVVPGEVEVSVDEITAVCRQQLAGYKRPKEIHFISADQLPRSTTGKIQRHLLESMLVTD